MSAPVTNPDGRLYGLDWLRAVAALAVVALHAGIAYTVQPFPGLAWPVHDPQPSVVVDALTWWIDAWIMPLFFIISGFLAAQLFVRLGPAEFLRHRTRRLVGPLAFACVVILPLDLYVWLLGWVVEERIPLKKLRSLKLGDAGADLWGIAHLWYLEYLLVFCVGAWGLAWGWRRFAEGRGRLWLPAKRSGVLPALAACSAIALWCDPQLVIGFRHAWHPLPANVLYYAPCFAAGWWMQTRGTLAAGGTRWAIVGLVASLVLIWDLLTFVLK
jgi:peptidoglycan/LPS O-acetylase OafA/YrhL